jgi:excisionase family DNA binding protein
VLQRLSTSAVPVIRCIRSGRLPATRIGKSYRIERTKLEAFAGVASGAAERRRHDRRRQDVAAANQHGVRLARQEPKVVVIGSPSDAAKLLEMLRLLLGSRS